MDHLVKNRVEILNLFRKVIVIIPILQEIFEKKLDGHLVFDMVWCENNKCEKLDRKDIKDKPIANDVKLQ